MSTEYMREVLRNVPKYKRAAAWIHKVNTMHAAQVLAVYLRMQSKGLLHEKQ